MSTQTETQTPKAEPAIRELSPAEMRQAGGAGIMVPDRSGTRGAVMHD